MNPSWTDTDERSYYRGHEQGWADCLHEWNEQDKLPNRGKTTIQIASHSWTSIFLNRFPRWWITRDRYGNPFYGKLRILLVAVWLYWLCTAHPPWAIIPTALLIDLVVRAEGHWPLRFFVGWFLVNIVCLAFAGVI
jgi:hypothetical protein